MVKKVIKKTESKANKKETSGDKGAQENARKKLMEIKEC
jgi:hypothetical protein